jgi:wyosine [tRNA(Phe)-imidazoG37] synthetase (radical SAM superfamily)
MTPHDTRYVYGPVPSRRLGRSLGIDLVPFKTCTYDCIYCQLGRTTHLTLERKAYVPAETLVAECRLTLDTRKRPDIVSLAGSGEPTLNSTIGEVIHGIKKMTDVPVAVLTNGALLWQEDVQDALMAADVVLPSLDAGQHRLFQQVNRPHPALSFEQMVGGLVDFTHRFAGEVWLEVFLLAGLTGTRPEVEKIAALVKRIQPARVQLNTVCRPPAETIAATVSRDRMGVLAGLFHCPVDIISRDTRRGSSAAPMDNIRKADIIAMLGRRPCTADDVARGLGIHINEALKHLEALVTDNRLDTVVKDGELFYMTPSMKA